MDRPTSRWSLRRLPLHPLLLAALPVLMLWWQNASEVTTSEALRVLLPVVAVTLVVAALASLALRDARRGALAASAGAFLYLSYGHLWGVGRAPVLGVLVWLVLLVVAVLWVRRADEPTTARATLGVNLVALLLVALTLPGVATAGTTPTAPLPELGVTPDGRPLRDILYIVPDRYGREDNLQATFGIDNSAFTELLERRDFQVLDDVLGNYPRTSHSLAATLSMEYLDDVAASIPVGQRDDLQPAYRLLRDHRVGDVLKQAGYEYIHIGSWWSPTATATDADVVLNYDSRSEFAQVFADTTLGPTVLELLGVGGESSRERRRNHSAWQLDQLDRLLAEEAPRPRFILAHITLPHEPYVFDEDGSEVSLEQEKARTRADSYERQLRYLNTRLERIVDAAVDQPDATAPIVLIQSDEGPHTHRQEVTLKSRFRFAEATDEELRTKLRVFSAYRLPGEGADVVVPEDLSPVNSFRLILDTYLGTELGLLPDRSFTYPDDTDRWTFTDVTDRVRDVR